MSLSPKSKAETEDAAACPVSSFYPHPPPLSSVPQDPGVLRNCCQFSELADIPLDWMLWKKVNGGIYSISTLPRSPLELKAAPSSCQKAMPTQLTPPIPLTCPLSWALSPVTWTTVCAPSAIVNSIFVKLRLKLSVFLFLVLISLLLPGES